MVHGRVEQHHFRDENWTKGEDSIASAYCLRATAGSVGFLVRSGNSLCVLPCSVRPWTIFRTPPHHLKKNGTLASSPCCRMESTHASCIGRAPGPLSPPTITHEMPSSGSSPRLSSRVSTERKRTAAGESCRSAIWGRPCFFFSTETPHQICCSAGWRKVSDVSVGCCSHAPADRRSETQRFVDPAAFLRTNPQIGS